jgi:hypothetical protein
MAAKMTRMCNKGVQHPQSPRLFCPLHISIYSLAIFLLDILIHFRGTAQSRVPNHFAPGEDIDEAFHILGAPCLSLLAGPGTFINKHAKPEAKFDYYLLSLSWVPNFCASHAEDHSSECQVGRHTAVCSAPALAAGK